MADHHGGRAASGAPAKDRPERPDEFEDLRRYGQQTKADHHRGVSVGCRRVAHRIGHACPPRAPKATSTVVLIGWKSMPRPDPCLAIFITQCQQNPTSP